MKLLRDIRLLFGRQMVTTLRNPVWVIMGLFQPVCWLLLFAPLLDALKGTPGFPEGGGLSAFTPGILITLGMTSAAFVGFGLINDLRSGLFDRLRVTPVHRFALLISGILRDIVVMLVQVVLLMLVAWPLGLRTSLGGVLAVMALLVLLSVLMSACSYTLALLFRDENALASTIQFFALPLTLLSGVMLPLTFAPGWLRALAAANPFSHAVDAARALMSGHPSDGSVLRGFVFVGLLAALTLWWAERSFRRTAL